MSHLKAPICPFSSYKSLCLVHAVLNIFHLPFQTHLSCLSSSLHAPGYRPLWTTSKAGVGWANRGHQQEIRGRQERLRPGTDSSGFLPVGWLGLSFDGCSFCKRPSPRSSLSVCAPSLPLQVLGWFSELNGGPPRTRPHPNPHLDL